MSDFFFNFQKITYIHGPKPPGCILCSIINHSDEVERLVVAEHRLFVVAVNLYPFNAGHCLIFPKRHITDIREMTAEEVSIHGEIRTVLMDCIEDLYHAQGFNIGFNNGRVSGASIEHIHEHIIPRFPSELGIADLLSGNRIMIEPPYTTCKRLTEAIRVHPQAHAINLTTY